MVMRCTGNLLILQDYYSLADDDATGDVAEIPLCLEQNHNLYYECL